MAKVRTDDNTRFRRSLVTPEGVDIGLRIASAAERAGAFIVDAIIILLIMIGLSLLAGAAASTTRSFDLVGIVWLIGFFVVRNFYFTAFEISPRAATPGKRLLKIRVASRSGGILGAEAVFARNAMRELEVFLPLTFIVSSAQSIDAVITLLGLIWAGIFVLFPLFNRDRLRAGDIIAGSWVVQAPARMLLPALAANPVDAPPTTKLFTVDQLDAYGVKELQVLEDVLRANTRESISIVAVRIRAKIGWTSRPDETDRGFLNAYYIELRRHLESRLLMGKRRADKHDRMANRE